MGERQKGVEANNSSNSHKGGKWSRVQTISAISLESLEIEIGKNRNLPASMAERESSSEVQKKKSRVSKSSEENLSEMVEAGSQPHQSQ